MKRAIPLLTTLALVLAACGSDDDSAATASADAATASATASATAEATASESAPDTTAASADASSATADSSAAAFPVTIEHKYGETTIEAEPQRVVSVGFSDQDWLLALGVEPIAIREWYGEFPYATWPWAQDELGDLQPEVLPGTEINFEQIAALDPDLIVGVTSGMTDAEYATLTAIAPTIAQPGEYIDYGVPWDVITELIGQATGTSERAAEVIAEVEGKYAAAREAHPEFDGATAAVTFYFQDMPGGYASSDGRPRLLSDLGFVTPPEFDEIAGDQFYFSVSTEEIGKLDADVVVWLGSTDEDMQAIAAIPTRPSMTAYAEGREVFPDPLVSGAFSFGSPLSIDYLLEQLVPELALAVDGDPATVVPSAAALAGADASGDAGTLDADQQAAADAWATVFDSTIGFDEKSGLLEDAEMLKATVESYTTAGEAMGGISLVPTGVVIVGDSATVTYDVMFGESAAYTALTGEINNVDGQWIVPRSEFCTFMASARNSCPA